MKLNGKIKVQTINQGSKDEHDQVFLQTDNSEKLIKIRLIKSNPFLKNELFSKEGCLVEIEGCFDSVSETFICDSYKLEDK